MSHKYNHRNRDKYKYGYVYSHKYHRSRSPCSMLHLTYHTKWYLTISYKNIQYNTRLFQKARHHRALYIVLYYTEQSNIPNCTKLCETHTKWEHPTLPTYYVTVHKAKQNHFVQCRAWQMKWEPYWVALCRFMSLLVQTQVRTPITILCCKSSWEIFLFYFFPFVAAAGQLFFTFLLNNANWLR